MRQFTYSGNVIALPLNYQLPIRQFTGRRTGTSRQYNYQLPIRQFTITNVIIVHKYQLVNGFSTNLPF